MLSGKMLWTIDNGTLRLVLRVYFITMTTLLGLIGSQCCKCAAKVDLLSGNNVKLNRMTGWLRPIDIWTCVYKLRRLPGGVLLGFVMITTTLLSLTADLAVSKFVLPVVGPSDCNFTTGLVMDWTKNETFVSPPPNGYPALIASNVQIYSAYSNCSVGIYNKVPISGDPLFCAKEEDVLGGWNCQDQKADQQFDPSVSESDIEQTLLSASLQYLNMSHHDYYEGDESHTTHLVIWSSSIESNDLGSPFNVLVSIDLEADITHTKTMKTFKCIAHSNTEEGQTAINDILSQMESVTALEDWVTGLDGVLYEGYGSNASTYAESRLEQYLNTMTMVQGGGNSVLSVPTDNLIYGCITAKVEISLAIVVLIIFTAFLLVVTFLYWIILLLIIFKHAISRKTKRKLGLKNIKPVPDSVIGWMLQAAREHAQGSDFTAGGAPKTEEDLRDWDFKIVDRTQGVARMLRARGDAMSTPLLAHETPNC